MEHNPFVLFIYGILEGNPDALRHIVSTDLDKRLHTIHTNPDRINLA